MTGISKSDGVCCRAIFIKYVSVLSAGYVVAALLTPLWSHNINLIHTVFEMSCITISLSTFLLIWNTYDKTFNLSRLIGFGFLTVAVFDLLHTYYFLGVMAPNQAYTDLSFRYWVLGRLIEAVMLYIVSLKNNNWSLRKWTGLTVTVLFSAGISLAVLFFPSVMPVMMTPNGLTPAKIFLQYVVMVITLVSLYNLRNKFDDDAVVSYRHIYMALLLIVPAELSFTLSKAVTSFYSVYGHMLKIIYYYYLYKAVFVKAIIYPYKSLESEHKELEKKTCELQAMAAMLEEKRKNEQQLMNKYINEAQKLTQLIELCPLAILVIDAQARVIILNQAFLELVPVFTKEQLIGQHYKKISDALNVEYEKAKIIRALRGETINQEYAEVANRRWLCSALPVRDANTNGITGAICIYHDVTEYERMREQMARFDRLGVVAQIAAGVAHEIRNPMTVVRGYIQFLATKLGDTYGMQLALMIDELDRANSIITDFLSLAGNRPSKKKPQDLNRIIRGIHPLIYCDAINRSISIELNLAEELPLIDADDNEIRQLIHNLSRNAFEAMEARGTLTIETKNADGKAQVIIADTGCGISREQLGNIFNPFYTTKDNGTGLGLAVSLNIIKSHNASVDVESQEGKGTKFIITFN